MDFIPMKNLLLLVNALLLVSIPLLANRDKAMNVLFITVDDLRPELGCYDAPIAHTPTIDRLADTGMLFERAYCNVPTCGASRASMLSGARPTAERFRNYNARHDLELGEVPGLPEWFRSHGYHTVSNGKVYHHRQDTPESWSEIPWVPEKSGRLYLIPENAAIESREGKRGPSFEAAEVPDNAYPDGMLADKAIRDLHRLKAMDEPFFLAVGFYKPHLPFNAPKKYWDLYNRDQIPLADNPFVPLAAPEISLTNWGELRNYHGIPKAGNIKDEALNRSLVHGYLATTSYVDAQVGKVIDTLERLGMADNTLIVLMGDHGFQLGEHTIWSKHTNYEIALRIPLIILDPRLPGGRRVSNLVELVDIYPTLCDLAGLEKPSHLAGQSMVPLLSNPAAQWKRAVFSRFHVGESIRTNRYRYSAYFKEGKLVARMLYDHRADTQENINLADHPEMRETVAHLHERLLEHLRERR